MAQVIRRFFMVGLPGLDTLEKKMKRNAFTLIELLVVVLIIGILSAMALAQYQRAVNRARGAEVLTAIRSISDALNRYYLANSSYRINSKEDLDITIPQMKHWQVGSIDYVSNPPEWYDPENKLCYVLHDGTCVLVLRDLNANVELSISLEKGKTKGQIQCHRVSSGTERTCNDYLPCASVVGSGDCTL